MKRGTNKPHIDVLMDKTVRELKPGETLSVEEICRRCQCSPKTIPVLTRTARAKLEPLRQLLLEDIKQ